MPSSSDISPVAMSSEQDSSASSGKDLEAVKMPAMASLEPVETRGLGEVEVAPRKNFNTLSTLSLAASLMATWEGLCATMGAGLVAGGPTSLVYGFLIAVIGNVCTAMSLSEPASMYTGAGGQYKFVSELSSPRFRPVVSFFAGWITLLGWVALTASAPYAAGNLIQGLIALSNPDYEPERWKTFLVYLAILILAFVFNQWCSKVLPLLETGIMIIHSLFFFIMIIVIAVIPPQRNSARFVFTEFLNLSGWEDAGAAWCLGMLTSAYITVGYDSATHLSSEVAHPEVAVPRAMIGSILINGTMGFALLIAVLFGMGSIDNALSTGTGFPIIEIFFYMTRGNTAATAAMVSTIIISASLATVGLSAASSRTLWAFARDNGPPAAEWLSKLGKRSRVPSNALMCITVALMLLGLLNIASTAAFGAILSLTVVSLEISYCMPVVAMLYRRLCTPELIKWGPWRMGPRVGILVNMVAIAYIFFLVPFLLLPASMPVTALSMNYAPVVIAAVLLGAAFDWCLRGRYKFRGALEHAD